MKKICIIGLGYIGLPTAAIFAKAGFDVLGVDVNERVVNLINKGEAHLEEAGLPELIKEVVLGGKLRASSYIESADVYIIAVPTDFKHNSANLEYVMTATKSILPFIKKNNIVIIESTIPVRTIEDIIAPIFYDNGINPKEDIHLAYCPERVLPGRILIELVENTRIVGGLTPEATIKAANVYRKVVTGKVIETKAITAEMTKLIENTYRDVNIALANELAKISDQLGVDTLEVIKLANQHPRVNLHTPGPGVGGHCIAVDPNFIVEMNPEQSMLIAKAREINSSMPKFVVDHVEKIVDTNNTKIAVLGVAYKGNIDDIRESPAIEVIKLLNRKGYALAIYDPYVRQEQVDFKMESLENAIEDADLLIMLTDHKEFKALDENKLLLKMKKPIIFDTKNCVRIKNPSITYFNYSNLYEMDKVKCAVTL